MLIICLQSIKTTTFKDVETQLLQSRRFEDVRLKLKCNYCHYCALVQKLELSEEIFQFHSQVQACVLRARKPTFEMLKYFAYYTKMSPRLPVYVNPLFNLVVPVTYMTCFCFVQSGIWTVLTEYGFWRVITARTMGHQLWFRNWVHFRSIKTNSLSDLSVPWWRWLSLEWHRRILFTFIPAMHGLRKWPYKVCLH